MRTREGNRSRHRTVHHPLCSTLITARTYCIAYSLLFTTHARVAVWPYGIPVQMNVDTTIGICACGAWRCSFCISHIYNFQYVCCSVELHYTSYRIIRFMLTRSITLSRPALLCFGSYRVMACRLISTSAPLQYTIHKFSVNFFFFFKRIRFNCQLTFSIRLFIVLCAIMCVGECVRVWEFIDSHRKRWTDKKWHLSGFALWDWWANSHPD